MSCPVCQQSVTHALSPCGHCLCSSCITQVDTCPLCRATFTPLRIYFDSQFSRLPGFHNLTEEGILFLKACSPGSVETCTNYDEAIGLCLLPLFKAMEFNPTENDLLIILDHLVPTLCPSTATHNLLYGFGKDFQARVYEELSRRHQLLRSFGTSHVPNTIVEFSSTALSEWFMTCPTGLSGAHYTKEEDSTVATSGNEQNNNRPTLTEHILDRQFEILNSSASHGNTEVALQTLRHLYNLNLEAEPIVITAPEESEQQSNHHVWQLPADADVTDLLGEESELDILPPSNFLASPFADIMGT
jgi:hypothetical protein